MQEAHAVEEISCHPATAQPLRRPSLAQRGCKRALDIGISGVLLVLLAPVQFVIALAIKLDSKGGVFFTQNAAGLEGKEFRLRKFRTMRPGSQDESHREYLSRNVVEQAPALFDQNGRPVYKTALLDSARITRVGRLLRKTSLDELPQLWSVLLGDMSLVGPRPSLPWEVELYRPWQRQRLSVKPGLTGLYQVTARNRVPVDEMIRIDIAYIRRQSLWLDCKILAKTPLAMLQGM